MAKRRLPSNWRSRLELVIIEDEGDRLLPYPSTRWELRFQLGRTPRGFGRMIGQILVRQKSPHFVADVWIESPLLRRGLGTMMYLRALEEFGSLSTLYHRASKDAQGLWKSLVRTHRYKHDFFTGHLTIFKRGRKQRS